MIAAHGNSLRAIVKHLFKVPDETIVGVEIPTGNPSRRALNRAVEWLRAISRHRATVSFAPNETSKEVSVPIVDDPLQEGDEGLLVTLTDPTGQAVVDPPIEVTLVAIEKLADSAGRWRA